MIHDVATTVSVISQYITLHPGDLIFTGTPGTTEPIKEGDVVEVELEGVGTLTNRVVRDK
jgi:2-keto-4-pentenoate hydratase/2-oxohepta-3-ene-1,7-dioic acid hydratase in catechol pathway